MSKTKTQNSCILLVVVSMSKLFLSRRLHFRWLMNWNARRRVFCAADFGMNFGIAPLIWFQFPICIHLASIVVIVIPFVSCEVLNRNYFRSARCNAGKKVFQHLFALSPLSRTEALGVSRLKMQKQSASERTKKGWTLNLAIPFSPHSNGDAFRLFANFHSKRIFLQFL